MVVTDAVLVVQTSNIVIVNGAVLAVVTGVVLVVVTNTVLGVVAGILLVVVFQLSRQTQGVLEGIADFDLVGTRKSKSKRKVNQGLASTSLDYLAKIITASLDK